MIASANWRHFASSTLIARFGIGRSIDSLKREWAAHNAFYAMGIYRNRTALMDLNWPQLWFVRLGYAILGKIAWPFIK